MPVNPNPPAITQPAPTDPSYGPTTPLMSQMIARAVQETPLQTPPTNMPDTSQSSGSSRFYQMAPLLGGLADVISTQRNLANGGREQNPMFSQNPLANGLELGGSYLAASLLSHYLANHGHPTAAKVIGYGAGLDGGISAAHNLGAFKWPGER